jgi:hypothetical protein
MIRIEVPSKEFRTKKGKAKASGNDYEINLQEMYLHSDKHYPDRFEWSLQREGNGDIHSYTPGFYTLADSAVQVNGEYLNLEINRYEAKLVRLPEAEQGQYAAAAKKVA